MGLQVARNPRAGPGAHAWSGLLEVLGDAFSSPWVLVKSLLKIPAHLSSAGGRTLLFAFYPNLTQREREIVCCLEAPRVAPVPGAREDPVTSSSGALAGSQLVAHRRAALAMPPALTVSVDLWCLWRAPSMTHSLSS